VSELGDMSIRILLL